MTDYRAKINQVELRISVPYPSDMIAAIEAENAKARKALAAFPRHAATLTRIGDSAEAADFIADLDWVAIRDEFRRKAKKLDMRLPDGDFPVSISSEVRSVILSVWVRQ